MNNFIVSVQAVIPMFSMLLIGLMVRKFKLLDDLELLHVNNLVFRVFLPLLLFTSIYDTQISEVVNTKLILFGVAAVFLVYIGALVLSLLIEKNNASRGAMIQAIYRSNFIILGLPIVSNIYGAENLGLAAFMIAVIVPVYNVLAVITLETFRGGRIDLKKVVAGIFENPLIIGAMVGIVAVLFNLRLPEIVGKTISEISAAATPMALIVLGASFRLSTIGNSRRNLIICVVGRLMVVPGLCLTAAAIAGFRDIAFVTLIGLFCAPCAISSFTMAQQMDSDSELAANAVVLTSALASFTMFFWIFLFKWLGMF
jgi:malate permease and related proteins